MYNFNKILNYIILIFLVLLLILTDGEHNILLFLMILVFLFPKIRSGGIKLLSSRIEDRKDWVYEIAELLINLYLLTCLGRVYFDKMIDIHSMATNFLTLRIVYVAIILFILNILQTINKKIS